MAKRFWKIQNGMLTYEGRKGEDHVASPGVNVTVYSGMDVGEGGDRVVLTLTWTDLGSEGRGKRRIDLLLSSEDADMLGEKLRVAAAESSRPKDVLEKAIADLRDVAQGSSRPMVGFDGVITGPIQAPNPDTLKLHGARKVVEATVEAVKRSQMLLGTPDVIMPSNVWDGMVRALDAYDKGWRTPGNKG